MGSVMNSPSPLKLVMAVILVSPSQKIMSIKEFIHRSLFKYTKEAFALLRYFIGKLISDAQAKIEKFPEEHGRKLYLYSAHENNIGEMLVFLDVFSTPHVPTYGSYLIFELHHINNTFGFKIFYQHYEPNGIEQLILPNCEEFCPIEKFLSLYKDYIPSDEMCGN